MNHQPVKKKKKYGKSKIPIKFIKDGKARQQTFCKRRNGLMKRAYELHYKTKSEIFMLMVYETGHMTCFSTKKFDGVKDIVLNLRDKSPLYNSNSLDGRNNPHEVPCEKLCTEFNPSSGSISKTSVGKNGCLIEGKFEVQPPPFPKSLKLNVQVLRSPLNTKFPNLG